MATPRINNNLVFFPAPFQGHITPILHLASLLHSCNFDITIIHPIFNSPDAKFYPSFNFISVADGVTADFTASTNSALELINAVNSNCPLTFYDAMVELLKRSTVRCVIVDALLYEVQAMARLQLDLPVIAIRTSSVACFNAFFAYPKLLENGFLPAHEYSEQEMEIPDLHPLRVRDLPDIKGSTPELTQLIAGMVNGLKNSSGIIFNSFEAVEGSQIAKLRQNLAGVPVFGVGPLHKFSPAIFTSLLTQDSGCMEWLDKQAKNSVVYVSFGSLNCMKKEDLTEVAWGLHNSNQPFLWVLRRDSISDAENIELPEDFLSETGDRCKIVNWAPQCEILKHRGVGAFWTHCGWNSTMESVCEGVPMLCSPFAFDQTVNSRLVCHVWRIGVQVEKLERFEIERGIKRLMKEKEGKEMREKAKELKERAMTCVKEGGSSEALRNLVGHILHSDSLLNI